MRSVYYQWMEWQNWLCSYYPVLSSSSISHCALLCLCYRDLIVLIKSTEKSDPSYALLPRFSYRVCPIVSDTIGVSFLWSCFCGCLWPNRSHHSYHWESETSYAVRENQAAIMGRNLLASFPHWKNNPCLLIVCLSDIVKHEFGLCHSWKFGIHFVIMIWKTMYFLHMHVCCCKCILI